VLISAAGSPSFSDTTTATGEYSLTGFGAGSYTVTPSKSGGHNGAITSFDAALVAQYAVGNIGLDAAQLTVADVSGTAGVSTFDAALIARFAVSMAPYGSAGNWLFGPASRTYGTVTNSLAGEDYSALLMGDVSGNWGDPSPFRPARSIGGPERAASVSAPRTFAAADGEVIVPVNVAGIANKGVIAYEFDLRYDPAVIQPQVEPVSVTSTVSNGLSVVASTEEAGLLRVAVYGPTVISGNGVLLNLRFTAIGAPGATSPLTFERMMLNEGEPRIQTADGQVELTSPATQAEIGGRVLTTIGQGVANTRVTLTDSAGQSRTVLSNGMGHYRFGGLQIGQTYTISVTARSSRFAPVTVSLIEQTVTADMIAQQ